MLRFVGQPFKREQHVAVAEQPRPEARWLAQRNRPDPIRVWYRNDRGDFPCLVLQRVAGLIEPSEGAGSYRALGPAVVQFLSPFSPDSQRRDVTLWRDPSV